MSFANEMKASLKKVKTVHAKIKSMIPANWETVVDHGVICISKRLDVFKVDTYLGWERVRVYIGDTLMEQRRFDTLDEAYTHVSELVANIGN
jgi:hypothetical protein